MALRALMLASAVRQTQRGADGEKKGWKAEGWKAEGWKAEGWKAEGWTAERPDGSQGGEKEGGSGQAPGADAGCVARPGERRDAP
jgi:hypothetical protein